MRLWITRALGGGALCLGVWGVASVLMGAFQVQAWAWFFHDARAWSAWVLGVWVTVLVSAACVVLLWFAGPVLLTTRWVRWLPSWLAVPHVAFAVALAWLITPEGLLARAVAHVVGWSRPPLFWQTVGDDWGLSLGAGLVFKEWPFLVWVLIGIWRVEQKKLAQHTVLGQSMGLNITACWRLLLWPQLLPKLRYAVFAVAAYAFASVEMALILGPTTPPPFAVVAWQWLTDPVHHDQGMGAVWVMGATLATLLALWYGVERLWLHRLRPPFSVSARKSAGRGTRFVGMGVALVYALVFVALLLASISGPWPFASPLPLSWQLWPGFDSALGEALVNSVGLALVSSVVSVGLVSTWLWLTPKRDDRVTSAALLTLLVLPSLLVAEAFYRVQLGLGVSPGFLSVSVGHTLMCLPYVWLVLAPAWRAFDPRYAQVAAGLGCAPWWFGLKVKIPMLAASLLTAWAIAVAVSVAQFLVTQFLGAGRVNTLTTEGVALASGGLRAQAGQVAFWQMLIPLMAFGIVAAYRKKSA